MRAPLSPRPKGFDAFRVKIADEFFDAAVTHKEVIQHAVVSEAVDGTLRAHRLPFVVLQVPQQV